MNLFWVLTWLKARRHHSAPAHFNSHAANVDSIVYVCACVRLCVRVCLGVSTHINTSIYKLGLFIYFIFISRRHSRTVIHNANVISNSRIFKILYLNRFNGQMLFSIFIPSEYSKRLDAELIRRGHDIHHKRYPIGYQGNLKNTVPSSSPLTSPTSPPPPPSHHGR